MSRTAQRAVCLLSLVFVTGNSESADALKGKPCEGARPVEQELKRSDAVFVGTVAALSVVHPLSALHQGQDLPAEGTGRLRRIVSDLFRGGTLRAVLIPLVVWKGPKAEPIVVETARAGLGAEGFPFELNESYIVYARYSARELHRPLVTSACDRTSVHAAGQGDTPALDLLTSNQPAT